MEPGTRITIYLPRRDAAIVKRLARAAGMSVSTWLRDAAVAVAREGRQPRRMLVLEEGGE